MRPKYITLRRGAGLEQQVFLAPMNRCAGAKPLGAGRNSMRTSDGISAKDWDVVHDLAVDVVNAPDQDRPSLRRRLLEDLDRLEVTYGALPSILATRADYLDDEDPRREELLLQAYALAESRHDTMNLLDVAHSLANCTLRRSR